MSYSNGPKMITNGLILYLDAANPRSYVSGSNTWNDLSQNKLSGQLINGTGYSSSNKGSLVFDGSNDFVQIPPNAAFDFGSSNFTLNMRMWISSQAVDPIVFYQGNNSGYAPLLIYVPGSVTVWASSNGSSWDIFDSGLGAPFTYNTWFDYTLTRSGNLWTAYIDGVSKNSSTRAGTLYSSDTDLKIGARTGSYNNYTNGNIASVKIYNRPLSADEVKQNYNATKGRYTL